MYQCQSIAATEFIRGANSRTASPMGPYDVDSLSPQPRRPATSPMCFARRLTASPSGPARCVSTFRGRADRTLFFHSRPKRFGRTPESGHMAMDTTTSVAVRGPGQPTAATRADKPQATMSSRRAPARSCWDGGEPAESATRAPRVREHLLHCLPSEGCDARDPSLARTNHTCRPAPPDPRCRRPTFLSRRRSIALNGVKGPLHSIRSYAQRARFDGPILQACVTSAWLSAVAADELRGDSAQRPRAMSPVPRGVHPGKRPRTRLAKRRSRGPSASRRRSSDAGAQSYRDHASHQRSLAS